MKAASLVKAFLNRIPGYQKRVIARKTRVVTTAKARLLASAKRRCTFNQASQQPEQVYSLGVQKVLRSYNQELRRLQATSPSARLEARGLQKVSKNS